MSKPTVRTAFSEHVRFHSPSPTGEGIIYQEQILDDGTMGLVRVGKHDLNEFVQASKEATLVYNILDRFQRTQDPSIFNQVKGFYADVTEMPKDLREAQNLLISLERQFASLDSDTKEAFDNNYKKFADSVLNGKIGDVLSKSVKNIPEKKNNEEVTNA